MISKIPIVFIGYDERQDEAYRVCKKSIEVNASGPVLIYPLDHRGLRQKGLFWRPWTIEGQTGRYQDQIDSLNFSNQFSHTRFLVPEYRQYLGLTNSPCIFVDCDFVFLRDIYELFDEMKDSVFGCVKHDYNPENKIKMDGQVQTQYPKKLWSSLMYFDPYINRDILPASDVNTRESSWLHRMEWINEKNIDSIDECWNFIPDHSEERVEFWNIGAIHYTEGLPTMRGYETCRYSGIFESYKRLLSS